MTARLNPYLGFRDTARDAMDFYQSVFGGDLTMSTFGEMHASEDPAEQDKIMHSQLITTSGFTLMASDTPLSMSFDKGSNFSVSLSGVDAEEGDELRGYWAKLIEGATETMPLNTAPWGDSFGMCIDKFGVSWMVNITATAS